jgi:hypothetical protein
MKTIKTQFYEEIIIIGTAIIFTLMGFGLSYDYSITGQYITYALVHILVLVISLVLIRKTTRTKKIRYAVASIMTLLFFCFQLQEESPLFGIGLFMNIGILLASFYVKINTKKIRLYDIKDGQTCNIVDKGEPAMRVVVITHEKKGVLCRVLHIYLTKLKKCAKVGDEKPFPENWPVEIIS